MIPINPDARVLPSENVFAREFDGEMVLLDLDKGVYYGLDPLATDVWKQLSTGKSVGEVVTQVQSEYDVAAADALKDLLSLASEWVEKGLVTLR